MVNNGAGGNWSISTTPPAANQWNHYVIGYNGTTTRLWINGVSVGTNTSSYNKPTTRNMLRVGVLALTTPAYYLTGSVSGLRFVSGQDLYGVSNTNIVVPTTPPTAIPNTSLLLNFTNGAAVDATGKNNLESVGNVHTTRAQAKWDYLTGGSSIYFDGTSGTRLQVSSTVPLASFAMGTGDYTIEFWMNAGTPTSQQCIFDLRNADIANQGIAINYNTSRQLFVYYSNAIRITTSAITANTWTHVAVVRYSGVYTAYINGNASGGTYSNSDSLTSPANRPYIGAVNDGSQLYNGYISNLRVTKGVARYTTNFNTNLPTGPFPRG
jgi:hypothetical protein